MQIDKGERGKLVHFLCGDSEDTACVAKAEKMLDELFSAPLTKEREKRALLAVSKESPQTAVRLISGLSHIRRERAERVIKAMKEQQAARSGARHPLSGMAGGSAAVEGGPAVKVKEADTDSIREALQQGIVSGEPVVFAGGRLKVVCSAHGDFYRLEYLGDFGPRGFKQNGNPGLVKMWTAETNDFNHAAELAGRALVQTFCVQESPP